MVQFRKIGTKYTVGLCIDCNPTGGSRTPWKTLRSQVEGFPPPLMKVYYMATQMAQDSWGERPRV